MVSPKLSNQILCSCHTEEIIYSIAFSGEFEKKDHRMIMQSP